MRRCDKLTTCSDFLLFVPHGTPSLRAILTYYTATGNVNSEGDVHVNDPLKGLGKFPSLFFAKPRAPSSMPEPFVSVTSSNIQPFATLDKH